MKFPDAFFSTCCVCPTRAQQALTSEGDILSVTQHLYVR